MRIEDIDRDALRFIAEGVTELAGFEVAAISIVDDGILQTVAVVGDPTAAAELMEMRTPVWAVLAELEHAESWGPLSFVPHERSPGIVAPWAWEPDMPVSDDPGAWHPEDLLCGLLHDAEGTLRGVLSIDVPRDGRRPGLAQRDVLQLYARQAERAVVTALQRGELARRMEHEQALAEYRRDLIDVFSHELASSVGAIANVVELIRADGAELPPTVSDGLSIVDRAASRIRLLVEDVLLLARLRHPHQPVVAEPVDLATLVRHACEVAAPSAAARSVRVQVDTPDHLDVRGSAAELDRVVGNLVSNAVKYNDEGGEVRVALRRVDGPSDEPRAELTVADDGIGIAPADQARLFEEFFRSSSEASRYRPGTGLGLTIVDRVVERHGGRVRVESDLGRGSVFTATIPVGGPPVGPPDR